jgi:hypothetical protein
MYERNGILRGNGGAVLVIVKLVFTLFSITKGLCTFIFSLYSLRWWYHGTVGRLYSVHKSASVYNTSRLNDVTDHVLF